MKKMHLKASSRLALLLGLGLAGLGVIDAPMGVAQQEAEVTGIETPAVEVTAYRIPTLLSETTQGVSVITREEIDARNPATAVELLRQIPGLWVNQPGGPGSVATVQVRGSDPEHVLVLIDGVRVNDPMLSRGGAYDVSSLDLSDVEQIEIIRGSGSAIYGADAMGGVINIVTRKGTSGVSAASIGTEVGGKGYARAAGTVSGGTQSVRYSATASTRRDGLEVDGGTLDLKTFSGSLSLSPSENAGVALFARLNDRDSSAFPDFSGGNLFATDRTLEQREAKESVYGADLTLSPHDKLDTRLLLSRYERTEDVVSPGVAPFFDVPPFVSDTDFTRDRVLASGLAHLPLDSSLILGIEYIREKGISKAVFDLPFGGPTPGDYDLVRKTDAVFAELKSVPVQNLTIQLGVRHDSPSDLDAETSPSAGIRYDLLDTGSTLKAHYSQGFRPPSFFALGSPLGGNPALQSETSKGYEVGLEQILTNDRVSFNLSGFKTDYKNLIDFDSTTFQLVNRNEVNISGWEFELRLQPLDNLVFGFNHTFVDSSIANSTANLRNRPEHKTSVTAQYSVSDAWQLFWTTVRVGETFDFSVPTGDVIVDSYTLTEISATYRRDQITLIFAVDNLFDEDAQQFVGFVQPGIRARAGVTARF